MLRGVPGQNGTITGQPDEQSGATVPQIVRANCSVPGLSSQLPLVPLHAAALIPQVPPKMPGREEA